LKRFLLLALPLLALTMALFHFALECIGLAPERGALAAAGITPPVLPGWVTAGTWGLEALGLAALFLLADAPGRPRWLTGLLAGWTAWVFRGPLLVIAAAGLAGLPPRPWWGMALGWWILYTVCGLLLAGAARAAELRP
jgi:hypothetical protein